MRDLAEPLTGHLEKLLIEVTYLCLCARNFRNLAEGLQKSVDLASGVLQESMHRLHAEHREPMSGACLCMKCCREASLDINL